MNIHFVIKPHDLIDSPVASAETASLHEQLGRYKEEQVVFQRQVSELKREQENLLAAATAAASKIKTLETTKGNVASTESGGQSVVTMVVMEDALEGGGDSRMPAKSRASAGVSATNTANTESDLVAATTARALAEKQVETLTAQVKKDADEIAMWKTRVTELETAKVTTDRNIADLTRQISGDRDEITRLQQLQQQQQHALDTADEQKKLAVASLEQALEQAATQATKSLSKLREEKDVALTEWKRASEMVDTLEGTHLLIHAFTPHTHSNTHIDPSTHSQHTHHPSLLPCASVLQSTTVCTKPFSFHHGLVNGICYNDWIQIEWQC